MIREPPPPRLRTHYVWIGGSPDLKVVLVIRFWIRNEKNQSGTFTGWSSSVLSVEEEYTTN